MGVVPPSPLDPTLNFRTCTQQANLSRHRKETPMETTDLLLAIVHHILVFSVAALIACESVLTRGELSAAAIKRLAGLDRHYGILAMLVIIVGVGRVFYGMKGWEFYVYNWVFWAKMVSFLAVGLLSIIPTMRFLSWNRQASANANFTVPAAELSSVRFYLRAEMAGIVLILIFAAAMARGYGY